jgi:transposase
MNTTQDITVGIDTGKHSLDIYIRPLGESFRVDNTDQGVKEAIKRIKHHAPTRIIIEATGRLEMRFACAATKAQLPIANAYHVHNFAVSTGQLAKTDTLDAKMIAYYGEALKPQLTQINPDNILKISDLLVKRSQRVTMRTMEINRLSILPKHLHTSIKRIINLLQKEIDKVEAQLDVLMEDTPQWQQTMRILLSVKGVGKVLAYTLLADLPELG